MSAVLRSDPFILGDPGSVVPAAPTREPVGGVLPVDAISGQHFPYPIVRESVVVTTTLARLVVDDETATIAVEDATATIVVEDQTQDISI